MKTSTVPTALLEAIKSSLGVRFYNNQTDATMSNVHIKMRVNALIARGVKFTNYTDGCNELIVMGEGVDQAHFNGVTTLTR